MVEDKGVKILVDPKAVLFLLGTEMDYKTEKLSAQFVFKNPNQTSACGCGELVQLTPARRRGRIAKSAAAIAVDVEYIRELFAEFGAGAGPPDVRRRRDLCRRRDVWACFGRR